MKQILLKKEVERVLGHRLREACDFEELSSNNFGFSLVFS